MRQIIIIGAGGQGKVVADIIHCCGDTVVGFLDDKAPDQFPAFNIIGTFEDIGKFEQVWYFPAIGDANVRETLLKKYSDEQWYTAIHPISVIADDVMIGKGTCVMANAVINPGVIIGEGCIVNTASSVDHDCKISDYVHIGPGVHLSGSVSIGNKTWVGIGAVVSNNLTICNGVTIGAGTAVIDDIIEKGTYVGVPARKIK